MCGRFTLTSPSDAVADLFDMAEVGAFGPRYNVAPTQEILAVRAPDGEREAAILRWGLVPFFAKDPGIGARMINARGETVAGKPAFRAAFKRRRCLIPADGFYEWEKTAGGKQPHHFSLADGRPFAFAGLWERWSAPEGDVLESCTVITTTPNALVAPVHDRMPVILDPADFDLWLDPTVAGGDPITSLIRPHDAADMRSRRVSRTVNSARNEGPACLADPA